MTSDTFNILYIAFLMIGVVLAVFAVVQFFVFDIKSIYRIKTGRAIRQGIQKSEKSVDLTGRFDVTESKIVVFTTEVI